MYLLLFNIRACFITSKKVLVSMAITSVFSILSGKQHRLPDLIKLSELTEKFISSSANLDDSQIVLSEAT